MVSGLRGAADADHDGAVTLDEAYRYAHDRTLVTTTTTAVGAQHATIETAMRGAGAMVLTRPAGAPMRLRLPAAMQGEVLVHRRGDARVFAEVYKAAGEAYEVALPLGDYVALARREGEVQRCEVAASGAVYALASCEAVPEASITAKGDDEPGLRRWWLTLGTGVHFGSQSGYTRRLGTFDFEGGLLTPLGATQTWYVDLELTYLLSERVGLTLDVERLDARELQRETIAGGQLRDETFTWSTWSVTASARYQMPLGSSRIVWPYVDAGVGVGLAPSELEGSDPSLGGDPEQLDVGVVVSGRAGVALQLTGWFSWRFEGGYTYAPVLTNLIGDTHDSGGWVLSTGLSVGL